MDEAAAAGSHDVADADGHEAVVAETFDAAATAAADAAENAIAALDEVLIDESSSSPAARIELESTTSGPQTEEPADHVEANATTLDNAQIFLSQSLTALRARASSMLNPRRSNGQTTVPSSVFADQTTVPSTEDTSAAPVALGSEFQEESVAPSMSVIDAPIETCSIPSEALSEEKTEEENAQVVLEEEQQEDLGSIDDSTRVVDSAEENQQETITENETGAAILAAMGFPLALAEEALCNAGGDVSLAVECLLHVR
jgi:hypothetical protein